MTSLEFEMFLKARRMILKIKERELRLQYPCALGH